MPPHAAMYDTTKASPGGRHTIAMEMPTWTGTRSVIHRRAMTLGDGISLCQCAISPETLGTSPARGELERDGGRGATPSSRVDGGPCGVARRVILPGCGGSAVRDRPESFAANLAPTG